MLQIGRQIAEGLAAAHAHGADPPRHQAGKHPDRGRSAPARQDHRLRPGPGGRRRQHDPVRDRRRHADVHGPGAGAAATRSTIGPTCSASAACSTRCATGRPPFRAQQHARGPQAGGRGHAAADPGDHPRGAAVALRHHRAAARQEAGRPVRHGAGGGGPAGATAWRRCSGRGTSRRSRMCRAGGGEDAAGRRKLPKPAPAIRRPRSRTRRWAAAAAVLLMLLGGLGLHGSDRRHRCPRHGHSPVLAGGHAGRRGR